MGNKPHRDSCKKARPDIHYSNKLPPIVSPKAENKKTETISKNQKYEQKVMKKPNGPDSYHLLDKIEDFHKPFEFRQKSSNESLNRKGMDFIKNLQATSFNIVIKKVISTDKEYLEALPMLFRKNSWVIDESKALFFTQGHNPVYSEATYIFVGRNGDKQIWMDYESKTYYTYHINLPYDLQEIFNNVKTFKPFREVGWILTRGHKWGFLLNLESISSIYRGKITEQWSILLNFNYFIDLFRKFAYHNDEEGDQQIEREIPNTDCENMLPDWFVPFNDRLFLHQKQESTWMFNLESYPAISLPKKLDALPFLDTGYYINLQDTSKLLEFVFRIEDHFVPGGILASDIGSGKTISCIALTSIGSQLKYKEYDIEESKMSNNYEMKLKVDKNVILKINQFYEEEVLANKIEKEKIFLSSTLEKKYEPSLIIATKNILHQWAQEYAEFVPLLKVFVIEKLEDFDTLTEQSNKGKNFTYDIVITHREIITQHDHILKNCSWFYKLIFKRIIMDEFHELCIELSEQYGGPLVKKSKNNFDMLDFYIGLKHINHRFTWGVTGTPDRLEYYSQARPLFRLLNIDKKYEQVNIYSKIKNEFVTTCMRKNPQSVSLPGLDRSTVKIKFRQVSNLLYKGKLNYALNKEAAQQICNDALPQWNLNQDNETQADKAIKLINDRLQEEISRLTIEFQKTHDKNIEYKLTSLKSENNFYTSVKDLITRKTFDCPICLNFYENEKMVITDCMHSICTDCFELLFKSLLEVQCPVCRTTLTENQVIVHSKFDGQKDTKLSVLVEHIQNIPLDEKIIVFTQYHSLVDELSTSFIKLGIPFLILRGEPSEINISLKQFNSIPELRVLLMSIEQSASGINVTSANHVYFAHPIFGMPFEKAAITYKQCIGRAYRLGQGKKVFVKLFVTKDTLEEDMIPCFEKYVQIKNA